MWVCDRSICLKSFTFRNERLLLRQVHSLDEVKISMEMGVGLVNVYPYFLDKL